MINNDNFKLKEIPEYHPIAQLYERDEWWREQKRRCIEGYWSSGKWMPPELYYYINFHSIKFEDDGGFATAIGLPFLRDIEWEKAYIYTEACGFSGFELDTEYTCHRWYGPEKEKAIKYGKITEEEVAKKKYIPAREYLRKIHYKNLGRPLYHNSAKNVIDLEGRGGGKQLPHSEVVITPNGPTVMGNIKVGDEVVGANGYATKVIEVFPQGLDDVYELELHDGRKVRCGLEHQWEVFEGKNKRVLETKDLLRKGLYYTHTKNGGKSYKYKIRNTSPVFYKHKELPIPPYVLGALLGDGTMTTITPKIASSDKEILDNISKELEYKYELNYDSYTTNNHTIKYIGKDKCKIRKDKIQTNPLRNAIVDLGINKGCKDKFIPEVYKYGSIEQRLYLLQGLLDTDGSINCKGSIEFTNTNERLVDDLIEVARSLGIQCRKGIDDRSNQPHKIKGHECYRSITYRAYLRTDLEVFRLTRKKDRIKPKKRNNWVSIVNIKKLDYKEESSCIMVDNKDHTFLTNDYVVTHNSYWASGCIAHNFLFDGARNYDEHLRKRREGNPYVSDTVVGAIDAKFSSDLLSKVKVGVENLPGSMMVTNNFGENEIHPSPLSVTITGSLASGRNWKSSTESVLNHRTFADNPLAANGTRPNRCFLEEVGFMTNIKEAWGAIEATQAAAQHKRLVIYGLGTGGLTTAGAALYTQEIYYNPEDYNCLVFEDIWENKGNIGFFLPAYLTRNEFKEGPNNITNEEKANMAIDEEIEEAKKGGSKIQLLSKIINNPRKPSEIFLRLEGNKFPTQDLKQALADLESSPIKLKSSYKVDLLEKTKNSITMVPSEKSVITAYPLGKNDTMDACIEIFQKPKLDAEGRVFTNRYIMATDPVDDDGNEDTSRSLQSTFILDTWTDKIVAEYTARTYLASEYYENVRKLCVLYDAKNLYENNKKGLYGHFKNKHALFYLAETPQILKDQELVKSTGIGNRSLGVNMSNDRIKLYGIDLLLEWLEKSSYDNPEVKNLYTIRSQALLKELISFSMDINADRVSSMIALMIYRAELDFQIESYKSVKVKTTSESSFWGNAYKKFNKDKVHRNMTNLLNNYDTN